MQTFIKSNGAWHIRTNTNLPWAKCGSSMGQGKVFETTQRPRHICKKCKTMVSTSPLTDLQAA